MTKSIDLAVLEVYDVVEPSEMTVGQIITEFRQAKDRKYTLQAIADQTCLSVDEVKYLLVTHGVKKQEMPRNAKKKKDAVENFRGGWRAIHPIRNRLLQIRRHLRQRMLRRPSTASS